MTTDQIVSYYADLLIIQYRDKPKARAQVSAFVYEMIMDQIYFDVQNAFDITSAIGVQLDVLGKYIGTTRSGYGITGTPINLNDDDYRTLLMMKMLTNNSGSSLADIQNLISIFFSGKLLVYDSKNMNLSYFMDPSIGSSDLAEMIITKGFLPNPMGVGIGSIVYAPLTNNFFGFRTVAYQPLNNSPFNSVLDYHTDRPWLSVQDTI